MVEMIIMMVMMIILMKLMTLPLMLIFRCASISWTGFVLNSVTFFGISNYEISNQSIIKLYNHTTLNHKNSLHNCKICYQGGVYIKHIVTKVEYCTYWRYWRYCYQGGQGASWFPWMATDTTCQNIISYHHNLILSIMVGWLNYNVAYDKVSV